MATPATSLPALNVSETAKKGPGRTLRLEEILTLLVADGLVAAADADVLARHRLRRSEHPLETIAEKSGMRSPERGSF
jgi:hypothetical protein